MRPLDIFRPSEGSLQPGGCRPPSLVPFFTSPRPCLCPAPTGTVRGDRLASIRGIRSHGGDIGRQYAGHARPGQNFQEYSAHRFLLKDFRCGWKISFLENSVHIIPVGLKICKHLLHPIKELGAVAACFPSGSRRTQTDDRKENYRSGAGSRRMTAPLLYI